MRTTIVVPDDFPSVFARTTAEAALRALGDVTVHTVRGAEDEAELIRRIGDAAVVVNIRAYSKFTARVLAACPNVRHISDLGQRARTTSISPPAARVAWRSRTRRA